MTAVLPPRAPRALPTGPAATAPIEATGQPRDHARLLVAGGNGALSHHRLRDLPELLRPGDVLVVNTSAVLPAALPTRTAAGDALRLHLATRDPASTGRVADPEVGDGVDWIVEVRRPRGAAGATRVPALAPLADRGSAGATRVPALAPLADRGSAPYLHARSGQVLALPDGGRVRLRAPFSPGPGGVGTRLWHATLALPLSVHAYLHAHGAPIRYAATERAWPLETYQTVFARHPGSAESPSAARGFTPTLVARLVAAAVDLAPILLHTGVSSPEAGEPPYPEWHEVPASTAARVNAAARVLAVGTTAVRALETAADDDGVVHPSRGWTDVVVTPERGLRVIEGLLTGWHEPEASHLDLLEAVAGPTLVADSYAAAAAAGYRWHELGDTHLLLP